MGKKANRIWSMILVIVMLINMLPLGVLAEEYQANAASTTVAANQESSIDDVHIISEVTENRTEFVKEFKLSNGLHMVTV